jgi:folate-binding protein YgfZ
MEINETTVLDDRGFIHVSGDEAKEFLQNIVTNDVEKVSNNFTIFSSIFTPQGKYLYDFFILKGDDGYILECEKSAILEVIKIFDFYKLRSKVNLINISEKYNSIIVSLEKFKEINKVKTLKGSTSIYNKQTIFIDPRNKNLGAKIVSKIENIEDIIKKLNLKKVGKDKYYQKSFELGIPQVNLKKLRDKIFGIENNLDELGGIDFKKGCYIGQENTSRIKLRNKLRRRVLPIKKISGNISENDTIKYKDVEIGKIMIAEPHAFALIKVIDPNLDEFVNDDLICEKAKVKVLKPDWI